MTADRDTAINLYDRLYARLTEHGTGAPEVAALAVVENYLDGKPRQRDKKARPPVPTETRRSGAATSSRRYRSSRGSQTPRWRCLDTSQERTASTALLGTRASSVPGPSAMRSDIRASFWRQHSPRRSELDQLAASSPDIAELCRVLDILISPTDSVLRQLKWAKRMLDELCRSTCWSA